MDERIRRELQTQRRPITLGLICSGISAGLYSLIGLATKTLLEALDQLSKTRHMESFHSLLGACGIILGIFAVRYIFARGQTYYLSEAVARLTAGLRMRLVEKLLRLPVSYFNDKRSGSIQSIISLDVNVFQSSVQILRSSIEAPVKAIGALVFIFWLQWQMALVTLLMIPFLGVIIHQNGKRMRKATAEVQEELARMTATSQETLQGVRVIKAFGAESQMAREYARMNDRSIQAQLKTASLVAILGPLVEFLGALGLVLAFTMGGYLALNGQMTVAKVAALAWALDAVNQGFKGFSGLSSTYAGVQAAADRIYSEILDIPEPPEHHGNRKLDQVTGRIEFQNVSFAYPDGTKALDNVSFTIEPGESLALVGPSGAGKSTLADLLLRFYEPTSGKILVDGVDLSEIDSQWFRSILGVVPQQTFLFAGTIDENLKLGAETASDSQLNTALQLANAAQFTQEFRDRALPVLGERGVRLSGGQMQRIAIARALVRDPKILVLDEATSALDAASEKLITEALDEVMKTRTTLFIAHRLTTAARASKVALLKRGQLVEIGTHAELLESNGEYAALFKLFTAGVIEDGLD